MDILNFTHPNLRKSIKLAGVYIITHADGVYIGSTTNLYERKHNNEGALRQGRHHCKPLQEAFDRDPRIELKVFITDPEKTLATETDVLMFYRNSGRRVFNQGGTDAASPGKGKVTSVEVRQKIAIALTGRTLSASTKEKIRESVPKVKTFLRAKSRPVIINGVRYWGILEANEKLGLSYAIISGRIRSASPEYKLWTWADE